MTTVERVTGRPYSWQAAAPNRVYIGRPSKWGNPFAIGKDGTREEVISKYREWIEAQPALMDALAELRGKVLGCWCKPDACHGDVLVLLVEDDAFDEAFMKAAGPSLSRLAEAIANTEFDLDAVKSVRIEDL